jgi:hypothetical protein
MKDGRERVRANQYGSPSFMLQKKYFIQFPSLTKLVNMMNKKNYEFRSKFHNFLESYRIFYAFIKNYKLMSNLKR